ncbi:MAG TPA: 4-hydroxy-tetrahydrodipicolinate reductase [Candidatus Hydrogenedentes bacterium]|nr:4-hydroxy-tetrahydrodipicolinate reductase [Candidatus Hydrogenedentota bacterium]HPG65966.1 4-hydroxy-tetrahydrodipicolinate reductase [Candidatus Hydrogenedentota bacterium]
MKICMAGACGRMGRRILELAAADESMAIGGAFDAPSLAGVEITVGAGQVVRVGADAASEIAKADVLIDFTVAGASVANVQAAAAAGKPAVVGTTGLSEAQKAELAAYAQSIPVVHAPNMSVGVNLLFKLTGEVAAILGLDYNVEIVEVHHNQKKDSPSGTAVRLAERAAEGLGLEYPAAAVGGRQGLVGARPVREIGVHAVRGGDVVGEHTVYFIGQGERVELTHKAHSRDNFARGALRAARFVLHAAPGLYDMQDVLGLR